MEVIRYVVKELPFLLLTPAMLLGSHYHRSLPVNRRIFFAGFMAVVVVAFGIREGQIIRSNIAHLPKWDFVLFWLYGRVAAQGLNFYEPEHAWHLVQQHQLSVDDPIRVWFLYPPQTMFLFMPLGWFGIQTAHLLWYILIVSVLALDIFWLWKIFLNGSGWAGLLLTAALMLTLKATSMTIYFAQTNFIVLLMLLLFWREGKRLRSGVWLAIGIFTKPVLAILPMFLVLQRNWRVIVSTLITLAVISLLAVITFGQKTVFSYFTSNPIAYYAYDDPMNSSLLATVLHLTGYGFNGSSPLFQPAFVILSLVLTSITGWLVFRLGSDRADWALSLTLALALLVCPATLEHYSLLLIAPILLLWGHRQEFIGGVWGVVGFITLEYALIHSHYVFMAIALIWCVSAGIGAWMIGRRSPSQQAFSEIALCYPSS